MSTRISQREVYRLAPRIVKNLTGLSEQSPESPFNASLTGLIRMRVSQINGCAFCMHMHAAELRSEGESQERLDILSAWREAPDAFSREEKSALHWAEALTNVSSGVSNEDFNVVAETFAPQAIVELTTIILEINSWNRISVGFSFVPEINKHSREA